MKILLFAAATLIFSPLVVCQTTGPLDQYRVSTSVEPYDTIANPQSLWQKVLLTAIEFPDSLYSLSLPFTFPFNDSEYNSLSEFEVGALTFDTSENINLFLLDGDYDINQFQVHNNDPNSTYDSDIRISLSADSFVLEYKNLIIPDEIFPDGYSTFINMKYTFSSNGTISIHVGPNNASESLYWIDGFGWTFEPGDRSEVYGPHLILRSESNPTGVCFDSIIDNSMLIRGNTENCRPIGRFPSEGTRIVFTPSTVSSIGAVKNSDSPIELQGSIVQHSLLSKNLSLTLYNAEGKLIRSGIDAIPIGNLKRGLYIAALETNSKYYTKRFAIY